ncbi:flagellar hook-associated protein FlgK [Pelagovum pacificum]|uniref:Flagellar hook-associated protein 1 n=1 Tax=Pelagovum pacificum TaxID=2588711 RepID=A0A5C5GH77_9RHOB|nr:flagellar hook-associated protein FlgK [Pelagovum pacificum]QQA42724.1 flagellar hook-associated protein FlgK [Pelagovum pacificum]TNY34125.1 flagellar hook-associated protein FlgK [Pelagovum pacificum]
MSFAGSINAALSGLSVAAKRAEVVSSNVANAQTDGYGRRSLVVVGAQLGGVRAAGVVRHMDMGIVSDRRLAEADMSASEQSAGFLDRLNRLIGEVGETGSLTSMLTGVEKALVQASADPSSDSRLTTVLDEMKRLTGAVRTTSDGIQAMRAEVDQMVADQVETLNEELQRVAKINSDIQAFRNNGIDPSSLFDLRQISVDAISSIVPVRELNRGEGRVALMTPSGQMLLDMQAVEVGFTPVTTIVADMTFASGALSGLTIDGDPVAGGGAAGKLAGGTLGGALSLRDDTLPAIQSELDAFARDLVERFSDPAADPTLLPGDTGLFTDAGGAFDPLDTDGLSGRISVNALIDPASGGSVSRIRDGLNAATVGPVGSSTQIERLIDRFQAPRATHLGIEERSVAGHLSAFYSDVGTRRFTIDTDLAFQSAKWESLKSAELSKGVDTDEEMQSLMLIEQSYAANARVLETIDTLTKRLLEI